MRPLHRRRRSLKSPWTCTSCTRCSARSRPTWEAARIWASIGVVLADSGYYSETNLAAAEATGPELLIAVMNERDQRHGTASG